MATLLPARALLPLPFADAAPHARARAHTHAHAHPASPGPALQLDDDYHDYKEDAQKETNSMVFNTFIWCQVGLRRAWLVGGGVCGWAAGAAAGAL